MNILMIGSGGREHALVKKLIESPKCTKLYCAPGNGGISRDAEIVNIGVMDKNNLVKFAKENAIDLVFVAPDDPLADGMVDAFQAEGIRAFGPNANAAVIEASKVFSKNLMKKYNIPTAGYEVFDNADKAIEYIKSKNTTPVVVKADGLALGKGVIIALTIDEAVDAVKSIMQDKKFGDSGNNIVIEEFLTGPEVSVLAFTDGKCVKPMVSSKDHKRAFDNDEGLNTGGMGTVSPNPYYTDENVEKEKGIIGQEIKMYDDSPEWRVMFNMLEGMYKHHPVKIDIAGTVDTIAEITADKLYDVYNVFYNLNNMVICVSGNITVEQVLKTADKMLKPSDKRKITNYFEDEPYEINEPYVEQSFPVSMPLFNLGFKEKADRIACPNRYTFVNDSVSDKCSLQKSYGCKFN